MYLPKSKYSPPKYTRGDEFVLDSGKYYTGWYFTTYKNEYYTGKEPSKTSDKLYPEDYSQSDVNTPNSNFSSKTNFPLEKDYKEGFFIRYFLQDKRSKKIIEGDKKLYLEFKKKTYIKSVTVTWHLTSPAEDVKQGPYVYFGSASKNKESILAAEDTINGLSAIIKSYDQFVK